MVFPFLFKEDFENYLDFVKMAVLRCKTYAFTVQNSRFWNAKQ